MKLFLALAILLSSLTLFAHPASNVEVSYDVETQILNVSFEHKVKDADDHFIFEIKVYNGKKEIITQEISRQETLEGGSFQYKLIDVKPGDKLKVRTNCNKTGKKSATIVIG